MNLQMILDLKQEPDPLWRSLEDSFARENEIPPVDINVGGK